MKNAAKLALSLLVLASAALAVDLPVLALFAQTPAGSSQVVRFKKKKAGCDAPAVSIARRGKKHLVDQWPGSLASL